ncbi:hypothetical protein D3C80_1250220 [compost metagenome]
MHICSADIDAPAADRAQVAHRCGECREAVQRLAEALQRQGLHVVLQVGGGVLGAGAHERAQLAGGHGQWAAAVVQVTQAHAHLAPQAVGHLVQGAGVADLVDQAQLQVVLKVATHARHIVAYTNAQAFQQLARTDAGALQNTG